MSDFFREYFVDPVIQGSGYNIYNTLAYAALLIIAAFFVMKTLKKMKITVDDKFILGVLPFVVLGGLLRAVEDAISMSIWFKTPLIYIVIFVLAFTTLVASKLCEKKIRLSYHKIWFAAGSAFVIVFLVQVRVVSDMALAAITLLTVFWALLLVFLKKVSGRYSKKIPFAAKFFTWENTALLSVHMFDATTTFVALTYFPYFEQHVLPSFLINIFGPAVMFALKFVVVAAVLYALDKETKGQERKFIKLVILILGLAPGLRNFFRLVMGV